MSRTNDPFFRIELSIVVNGFDSDGRSEQFRLNDCQLYSTVPFERSSDLSIRKIIPRRGKCRSRARDLLFSVMHHVCAGLLIDGMN